MKKWQKILIAVVLIVGVGGFTGYKIHDYWVWRTPYQNKIESKELLSNKVDKLSNEQEEAFYDIARGAIQTEDKSIKFTNLDNVSLYVEKAKGKDMYYLDYIVKSSLFKLKFDTTMTLRIKEKTLKGDTPFTIMKFDSDLVDK